MRTWRRRSATAGSSPGPGDGGILLTAPATFVNVRIIGQKFDLTTTWSALALAVGQVGGLFALTRLNETRSYLGEVRVLLHEMSARSTLSSAISVRVRDPRVQEPGGAGRPGDGDPGAPEGLPPLPEGGRRLQRLGAGRRAGRLEDSWRPSVRPRRRDPTSRSPSSPPKSRGGRSRRQPGGDGGREPTLLPAEREEAPNRWSKPDPREDRHRDPGGLPAPGRTGHSGRGLRHDVVPGGRARGRRERALGATFVDHRKTLALRLSV